MGYKEGNQAVKKLFEVVSNILKPLEEQQPMI
jgi:hypothetical protein